MSKSTIAIIDVNVRSGQDELAREEVLARLTAYDAPEVTPLWVNWLRERADLRVVCCVHDVSYLDDFLVDALRDAPGVIGTSAVLSFGGSVHIEHLMDVPLAAAGENGLVAAMINIMIAPGEDRSTFDAIWTLPVHPQVRPVWLLRTYHSFDTDLSLFVLADREAAITGYVMSWIRPLAGVRDTTISSVKDWEMLATPDEMIHVAEDFFLHD